MTGGSGLFLDAVCNGLDALPQTDPEIRETLNKKHLEEGLLPLQQMLREADPAYYEKVDINNPQRVIRALEVFISSGKPYRSEEHTSELQSLMRNSYAVFCLQ